MGKRTEIIIETERIVVITPSPGSLRAVCQACLIPVEWLSPELAATLIKASPRLIYRWIESGQLHFLEGRDGGVKVCRNSLLEKYIQTE